MNTYREHRGEAREELSLLERIAKGVRKVAGPMMLGTIVALTACSAEEGEASGCNNPVTRAGEEGYLYTTAVFGSAQYNGTQVGPASPGYSWRLNVKNIDMRSNTYSEQFEILTRNKVNLEFQAHAKIRLRQGKVKTVVEQLGAENWYARTVKEQFRTAVRETVRPYEALAVPEKAAEIGAAILTRMRTEYKNTPIEFETISIGNMEFPGEITEENLKILKMEQRKSRAEREQKVAIEEAKVLEEQAKGIRKAQEIRNETLTPELIQMEAIKAYQALAESGNATFVIMPTNPNATGMPLILSADTPGAYRPRPTKAAPAREAPRAPAPAKAPTKAQ